jgi:signal transduction histidine kinase
MSRLLQGLLDYSRIASREKDYVRTDLIDVVRGVINDLEILKDKKGGVIEFSDLPAIEADPIQMQQLFQNLIGNALKYSKEDEKPLIRIYGEVAENIATISVEDNGIGFEEVYLEKIFRPLQRLHGQTSSYEGVGMGLAICRKIVERHSGSITAKSEPNRGATFIVSLPVKQKNKTLQH